MNKQIDDTLLAADINAYIIEANQLRNKAISIAIHRLINATKEALSTPAPTWVASQQAA